MAQIGRDHVVAIEVGGLQIEPGNVVERPRAARPGTGTPTR